MSSVVTVLLKAVDGISPIVNAARSNAQTQLSQLQQNSNGGISGALIGNKAGLADFTSGALFTGATAALTTLTALAVGVGVALSTGLSQAISEQTTILTTSSTIANQMGTSFDRAESNVMKLRKAFVGLAADLPGEVKHYTSAGNPIMAALAAQKLDEATFVEKAKSITKLAGFMAATTGGDATYSGTQFGKLISGGSFGSVQTIDIFERTPEFRVALEAQMKAAGKTLKDFDKLSGGARISVLEGVSKTIITPELVRKLGAGLDAQISTFKSSLFDPDSGIFGFLKAIPKLGNRTGLMAATELFGALSEFGEEVGKAIGFDPDSVMAGVISVIDWFTSLTLQLTGLFRGGSVSLPVGTITSFIEGIPAFLNSAINGLSDWIATVNWNQLGVSLGKVIGALAIAISNIDRVAILRLLGSVLIAGVMTLEGIIVGYFQSIGKDIRGKFNTFGDKLKELADHLLGWVGKVRRFLLDPLGSVVGTANPKVEKVADPFKSNIGFLLNPLAAAAMEGGRLLGQTSNPLPSVSPKVQSDNSTFSPTINVTATTTQTPEDLGKLLVNLISEKYTEYQSATLR